MLSLRNQLEGFGSIDTRHANVHQYRQRTHRLLSGESPNTQGRSFRRQQLLPHLLDEPHHAFCRGRVVVLAEKALSHSVDLTALQPLV